MPEGGNQSIGRILVRRIGSMPLRDLVEKGCELVLMAGENKVAPQKPKHRWKYKPQCCAIRPRITEGSSVFWGRSTRSLPRACLRRIRIVRLRCGLFFGPRMKGRIS